MADGIYFAVSRVIDLSGDGSGELKHLGGYTIE
jgi:hypothetical protein